MNEGALQVYPFNSSLTPVGQVMQLFSHHTGGELLAVPLAAASGDLDTTATVSLDGKTLIVTVANLNAVGWKGYDVAVTLAGWAGTTPGTVAVLEAQGYGERDMFKLVTGSAPVGPGGVAKLHVPAFSVIQATFIAA